MFNWAKQQLANVAGTAEPAWGPQAIRPVGGDEEDEPAYTELTRDDLRWKVMDSTNVETQTFYLFSSSGYTAWVQVIYSNVAGMRITVHFNVKIYSRDPSRPHLWTSSPLSNIYFSEDKSAFYADDCALELSEDGTFYTIKSLNDEGAIVNLKVTRTCPGFQAGKSGTSLFGIDPENPWGSMRHAFWPRCIAEGSVLTREGPIDFAGRAMFVYALQGMKPHHAAARWNFLNFQGPNYSAILMEFITPPSYGSTVVNVGGIAKDGALITAGRISKASHVSAKNDTENDWPEPHEVRYAWQGEDRDGKEVKAILEGSLGTRVDRLDVMAEVPGFIKTIVASAAGTKPYIYQYMPNSALKLNIGGQEIIEEGRIFAEATFISG